MRQKIFRLLPFLRNKTSGFTVVEWLIVVFVTSIILGIIFYAMAVGQSSYALSSSRANLQSEVRRTIGWIIKDTHQAVSWEIANNNPTPSYIKFRQVTGWDTTNSTFLLSNYYIEYTYNSVNNTITRRTSDLSNNTIGTWILNDVIAPPFFTINSSGSVVLLNKNDLLTSKQLIITISGQSQVSVTQNTTYTLTEEVQIRNG